MEIKNSLLDTVIGIIGDSQLSEQKKESLQFKLTKYFENADAAISSQEKEYRLFFGLPKDEYDENEKMLVTRDELNLLKLFSDTKKDGFFRKYYVLNDFKFTLQMAMKDSKMPLTLVIDGEEKTFGNNFDGTLSNK